jgi:two-component sensor histidine kinase
MNRKDLEKMTKLVLVYKKFNRYVFILTSLFTLIITGTLVYYFYNLVKNMDSQSLFWKTTFDHTITIMEKVSLPFQEGQGYSKGVECIKVDNRGTISASSIKELEDLNISPSAFFKTAVQLSPGEVHVGIYTDFLSGKPRVYITKRTEDSVVATIDEPGMLFPVNKGTGDLILVVTENRIIYSNNKGVVGNRAGEGPFVRIGSRLYVATNLSIRQMKHSGVVLLHDITGRIFISLIVIVLSFALAGLNLFVVIKQGKTLTKASDEQHRFFSFIHSFAGDMENANRDLEAHKNLSLFLANHEKQIRELKCDFDESNTMKNLLTLLIIKSKELLVKSNREAEEKERIQKRLIENQQRSLREKDVLIKEIHHRVKNNLQIIASLLSLQAWESTNNELIAQNKVTVDRIHSMGLVHELLYRDQNAGEISPKEYFHELSSNLNCSYGTETAKLEVETNVQTLTLNEMIPLALITNEFFTNTLKHAYAGKGLKKGTLKLLESRTTIEYYYTDNGEEFYQSHKAVSKNSLGMELIRNLVMQLRGELSFLEIDGTYYYHFKMSKRDA